jgi:hypothetical protein
MTLLRAVNLCVVATEQPGLVLIGALYVFLFMFSAYALILLPASHGRWLRSRSTGAFSHSAAPSSCPHKCPSHWRRHRVRRAALRRRRAHSATPPRSVLGARAASRARDAPPGLPQSLGALWPGGMSRRARSKSEPWSRSGRGGERLKCVVCNALVKVLTSGYRS